MKESSTPHGTHGEEDRYKDGEKLLGCLTVAYVFDVAGVLPPNVKEDLDSLASTDDAHWHVTVEEFYGISRPFIRGIYELCCEERKSKADALTFILRGLGCPDYFERTKEIIGGGPDDWQTTDQMPAE